MDDPSFIPAALMIKNIVIIVVVSLIASRMRKRRER